MNSEQNSSLTVLNTIFFGLLMGQVIFGVIAYVMLTENQYFSLSKDTAFFAVVCCVAVLGIYAGQFLFKKQLEKVHSAETLQKKINGYQTALIVKWALIEGHSLLALVAFLVTNNLLFFIVFICLVSFFFFQKPTKEKLIFDLELSRDMQKELR